MDYINYNFKNAKNKFYTKFMKLKKQRNAFLIHPNQK